MGSCARGVNVVGVRSKNLEEIKFEALYNEEVNFLANQGGAYHSNYPRKSVNQGLLEMKVRNIEIVNGQTVIKIVNMGRMIDVCL